MPPEKLRSSGIRKLYEIRKSPEGGEKLKKSPYALLLPGQGYPLEIVGVAKNLYKDYDFVKNMYIGAEKVLGYSLMDLTDKDLEKTMYAQPAIYVATLAAWEVYKRECDNTNLEIVAGYSFGDFAAAAIAGFFKEPMVGGLRVVKRRGEAYQKCCDNVETKMIALLGNTEKERSLIFEKFPGMVTCLINAGDNFIIGGPIGEFNEAKKFIDKANVKTKPVNANGAFHSKYVKEAKEEVADALNQEKTGDTVIFFLRRRGELTTIAQEIAWELIDQTDTVYDWRTKNDFLSKQGILQTVEPAHRTLSNIRRRSFGGAYEEVKTKFGAFVGSRWKSNPQPTS